MELKSKSYEDEMGEYLDWKRQHRGSGLSIQLAKLMKVRQIIALEKVKETIQLIDQCLQQDKKVIVFTNFTVKAAGVGITLTAAEVVIFNDLSFVPSDMSQCEDRAFRIGQDKKVSCLYPIYDNTIERSIYELVNKKKSVIDTVMGDNINEEDIFGELLDNL